MKNLMLSTFLVLVCLYSNAACSETVYVHSDILGSPIMETNSSGTVTSRSHYKPFGEALEGMKKGVGYTGHLNDKDLELTYMQARYYDPVIGRFYSNDPVGYTAPNPVMSFNRYMYVNNNPYKYKDPNGEFLALLFTPPGIAAMKYTASALVGIIGGVAIAEAIDDSSSEVRGENGRSTDDPVDLAEDLAGQDILGDFADDGGNDISDKMGDKDRYGENGTHDKLTGSKEHSDGTKTEVHGDRNRETGELSDTKFKDAPDNSKSRNEKYP